MAHLVYIVDDDAQARAKARLCLSRHGYITRIFETGAEFLEEAHNPQACIVLNVHLRAMNGLDVHRDLLRRGMALPVIFLDGDVPLAVQAMQEGAVDFLKVPYLEDELLHAVERAFALFEQGERLRQFKNAAAARLRALTPRGIQILQGLRAGMSNKTIARWLKLSPRTVESYRATMMAELGVRSLSQALRVAMDGDLAEIEPAVVRTSLQVA